MQYTVSSCWIDMRGHVRMTSDIAYMIPQAMPNIPPVEYITDGPLVGYAESLNIPVCLDFKKLIAPTGIFIGKIRTGKSTSAKAILARQHVIYHTNILIFDPHGEYSDLTEQLGGTVINMQKNAINPCKLSDDLTNKQKAMQLTDMLNSVFQFSDVQFSVLLEYITKGYDVHGDSFTFEILVKTIRDDFNKKSRDTVTLGAILRRVDILSGDIFGDENSVPLEKITKGIVCIDVSKLDNNHLRNMVMLSVLQYIYNTMLSNQSRESYNPDGPTRLIIMIDEAGRIASDSSSVAVKLVKESGKFKIGLFFGIQDIPDIDSKILSNYGFVFVHKLDNHEYISKIQQDCNFTNDQASRIHSLPVGTAFLKLNFKDASVQSPFTVRVLEEKFNHRLQKSEILVHQAKVDKNPEPVGQIRQDSDLHKPSLQLKSKDTLKEIEIKLLKNISENPTFNVTEHYDKLGIDTYHGNLAQKSLEEKGYIRGYYLKGRNSKKGKILEITQSTEELGINQNTKRHGGVAHKLLVDNIAARFSDYTIEKEFSIGGGKQIDLSINRRVAIEVETREFSSDNISKSLRLGFEKIIVICFPNYINRFREQLELSGINDSRVQIMTSDEILSVDVRSIMN